MEDFKDKIEQAKYSLVSAYLDKILESYKISPPSQKILIEDGLASLIEKLENPRSPSPDNQNSVFDGRIAQDIRTKAGLTLSDLAEDVGYSDGVSISQLEQGVRTPKIKRKMSAPLKQYLLWLKDQGYNPYNI